MLNIKGAIYNSDVNASNRELKILKEKSAVFNSDSKALNTRAKDGLKFILHF